MTRLALTLLALCVAAVGCGPRIVTRRQLDVMPERAYYGSRWYWYGDSLWIQRAVEPGQPNNKPMKFRQEDQ